MFCEQDKYVSLITSYLDLGSMFNPFYRETELYIIAWSRNKNNKKEKETYFSILKKMNRIFYRFCRTLKYLSGAKIK